ncbi:MAG: hypothetical protein HY549_03515 [Elusimicrobia bacterium]|nr:hypothetical protein [Elusimicrobiota bacterium]
MNFALALALALAWPGLASEPPSASGQAEIDAELEREAQEYSARLGSSEDAVSRLAERILQSSLVERITQASDPETRFREITAWIRANPSAAAGIGLGLARDDAAGNRNFETQLNMPEKSHIFMLDRSQGLFGRVDKAGVDSKLLKKGSEDIHDEEQREILRTMFEGRGNQSNLIIVPKAKSAKPPEAEGAFGEVYYDRLNPSRLGGYSPELQAIQSSLNIRRPPGAPKLIETGRLDYETLSYPRHGIRHDIEQLARQLRLERNWALARELGRRDLTPSQLLDPRVELELKSAEDKLKPSPGQIKRQALLEKARSALSDFEDTASAAKSPESISWSLLMSLGRKQREAARWITLAFLEEELQRIASEQSLWSAQFQQGIRALPLDQNSRDSYFGRGEKLNEKLSSLKALNEAAVKGLESERWKEQLSSVSRGLAAASSLRKNLSRDLSNFAGAAFALSQAYARKPAWRRVLDWIILKLLPWTESAKRLRAEQARRAEIREIAIRIARGDMDAADSMLKAYQGRMR